MTSGDHLDHDPAVLDVLDGFVSGIDREFLTNRLLDRDLTTLSYSTCHDTHHDIE